ncbi:MULTISPECIES: DUF4233 domain-containing protein [unclassified Streptomyces]|uniref:DUF4233 domain-containing protein n=1 Tax=unclassified Streptomyces TaxID=2593676 RepID=UPI0022B6215C|nr:MULTISPECIES: DUF4233 domain-containing protein [unclassified Streptomyces]MCZ7414219.1 DUF4233 domain-containing protein [Streptomyces sp. WMMC897]MCZ7431237.1 DUF4233 domain-containing protein [Streptomyces sp. WMMC1477]
MRTLCASTLIAEFLVIGFAGLVAMRLTGHSATAVWVVSGVAMALCLLLCGMLGRPGGLQLGWVLQFALIASGFVVPTMFVLGVVFTLLWWGSIKVGSTVDRAKAERAAA